MTVRAILLSLLAVLASALPAPAESGRRFTFRYATTVGPVPAGEGPVHVWVPLATRDETQQVRGDVIQASIPGAIESEDAYGNRFWHGSVERSDGEPITVVVETQVERPLNYFVYPYVEVGGRAYPGPIEKEFSYRESDSADAAALCR